MTQKQYPELDETLYRETLENGLTVLVVPRKGFTKKLAYFVTDFGSIHTDFRLDGRNTTPPPVWRTTWSTRCSTCRETGTCRRSLPLWALPPTPLPATT